MKFILYAVLVLIHGCSRSNPILRSNLSSNQDFQIQYNVNDARTPIQNIPYITLYVIKNPNYDNTLLKNRMTNYTVKSYKDYNDDINDMKEVSNLVASQVKTQIMSEQNKIQYIYDKDTGEYVVDQNSISTSVPIPQLQDRYSVNKRMSYSTSIPYGNAYAIMEMKNEGYIPNEKYFNDMSIKYDDIKISNDDNMTPKYQKINKEDIYVRAGIDVSNKVLKSTHD